MRCSVGTIFKARRTYRRINSKSAVQTCLPDNYIHDMHTLPPTRKPGGAHTIDLHH
jgi:hypothetical protein